VLSYRYAISLEWSHGGYSTTKVAGQQGYWRSDGALTFRSHSTADVAGCNGLGRRLTGVCAGQGVCGAPRRNRTGDPILTMDARVVHNSMLHLAYQRDRAGVRRCRGLGGGVTRGYV
jgi:hypothetical protein